MCLHIAYVHRQHYKKTLAQSEFYDLFLQFFHASGFFSFDSPSFRFRYVLAFIFVRLVGKRNQKNNNKKTKKQKRKEKLNHQVHDSTYQDDDLFVWPQLGNRFYCPK